MKIAFLAAASALALSASAAAAAPAVTEAPVNLHAGPSIRSPVVGAVPGGATVDVRGCVRSWCRVRFAGETGFVPRRYLALAGAPAVVAAAPGYAYDEPYYDYYDYGYDYGPSIGVFVGPGRRFHHRRWDGRTWQGQTWNGTRTGTWQGDTGVTAMPSGTASAANGSVVGGRAAVSAPVGMPTGGGAGVFRGGAGTAGGAQVGGGAVFHGGAAASGRSSAR